jgi:hypothetical protein
MSRLTKKIAYAAKILEESGNSDLAIVADVIADIQTGLHIGSRLMITTRPTSLLVGDCVVVTVASSSHGLDQSAVGIVRSGEGTIEEPYKIRFGKRSVSMTSRDTSQHLIKVTERTRYIGDIDGR